MSVDIGQHGDTERGYRAGQRRSAAELATLRADVARLRQQVTDYEQVLLSVHEGDSLDGDQVGRVLARHGAVDSRGRRARQ